MAYEQNKLNFEPPTGPLNGLNYSEQLISMLKRLATNSLGITQPADLQDGELFTKDNDPENLDRTLYMKNGDRLDKIVTFKSNGTVIFPGINEVDLGTDEVVGVLPKSKIITASATVQMDNLQNIVAYDGSKFQEVAKTDFIAENSIQANDIKYNIIDDNSPITDVKDLPYGWSVANKTLNNAPKSYLGRNIFVYNKYKRTVSEVEADFYIAYVNILGITKHTGVYATGYIEENNLVWTYDTPTLDLSISTEVSQKGTFSASQNVLMEENGRIKKIPKNEIVGLTNVDLSTQTTGVLPVNKGGTGNNDGFNFANFIDFTALANKINFEIGGTFEDFCLKLSNNCAFVTLIQRTYFSDNGTFGGILRISKYDNNSTWLYLDRFSVTGNDWRQNIGVIQNGKFSGWKTIRNNDGSIPANLINLPVGFSYIQAKGTGTPDTVFGTTGKWQEITSTATGFPSGSRIWKKIS